MKSSLFVDRKGNVGPMTCMVEYPVIALYSAKYGIDKPDKPVLNAEKEMIMVSGKGFVPEPGYYYEFIFEVFPPTVLEGFCFDGPLKSVVGTERQPKSVDSVFCYNEKSKYKVCTELPCRFIKLHTSMILLNHAAPLYFSANFPMVHPLDKLPNVPTLADVVYRNPDFTIVLQRTGTEIPVCKVALMRSVAFKTMLEFRLKVDTGPIHRIVMETEDYSDDVWKLAIHYLVFDKVQTDDIDRLLDLFKFGHEFQVCCLCLTIVHALHRRVEDGTFVGLNPYILSMLSMSVYYQSLDIDSELRSMLCELNRECEIAVCNRSYTLMRYQPEFIGMWHKYLEYKQTCVGPIEPPDRERIHYLGTVQWLDPPSKKMKV